MPTIEARVASLEAVQAQINEWLGNIEQEYRDIRHELRDIRRDARQNTRWLVGIQITTFITLATLILFKLA